MREIWRASVLRAGSFGLLGLCAGASGQSINADMDLQTGSQEVGSGVPDRSYGAAALQSGVWNSVDATGPWMPTALVGLDGNATSCSMYATGGIGSAEGFNVHTDSGGFKSLMDDFAWVLGANFEIDYHFSGFAPGRYLIYSYCVDVQAQQQIDTTITVPGAVVA